MFFGKKYTYVRQVDQTDCGAAALATVAMYYKRPQGVQRLREIAGTDQSGTNLLGMIKAAEQIGFSARAVKGSYEPLREVPLPAIAHVIDRDGLGHFVVVYKATRNTVVIADPARGVIKQTKQEFTEQWTGYLILLDPKPLDKKNISNHSPQSPWRRFVGILAQHTPILFESIVCALLMTLLGISTSYFVQLLVDSVLVTGETRLLNALGVGMILITLFQMGFGIIRQYMLAHVSRKIDLRLISDYTNHLLRLPSRFYETRQIGEIVSRVRDASKIRQAISGTALTAVVDGLMVCFALVTLFYYDAQLAGLATCFVPLLLLCIAFHHGPIKTRVREAMEDEARFSSHLVENVSGVETIKSYGVEPLRGSETETRLMHIIRSTFSLQMHSLSLSSAGSLITGVAGIAVLWFGGHRVIVGALSIGELMFFYTMLGYLLGPLQRLAGMTMQLQNAMIAIDRLYQVLEIEAEQSDHKQRAAFSGIEQSLHLKNVRFNYGCRADVLKDLDLEIPAGSTVAIVGESGSGKSTLLKLLMRFHDPTDGQILIDGTDYRDFCLESLRSRIGLVSQEPFIFSGSIYDNIVLGNSEVAMNDVVTAVQQSGLEQFVADLPERYETMIGERGANLSGGQKQRLAIARALLRNPDILVFDEATSHLDTATEQAIQQSLKAVTENRTVILVAHRLSTVKDADLICVMQDGRVAEYGAHQELLTIGGKYSELWHAQMGDDHAWTRNNQNVFTN